MQCCDVYSSGPARGVPEMWALQASECWLQSYAKIAPLPPNENLQASFLHHRHLPS